MILGLIIESRMLAAEDGHDMSLPSRRDALETYISKGKGDLHDIIEGGKYPPVFGYWELRRLVLNLLPMAFTHNVDTHNEADVPVAYNKGDDWFGATLGDPMVYTSAIYLGKDDDIWQGQVQKLNYILDSAMVKPGDKVLDIGCGWGRLLDWYARAGAQATGMTLSTDQADFGRRLNKAHGDKVNIILDNFMTREIAPKSFDVISLLRWQNMWESGTTILSCGGCMISWPMMGHSTSKLLAFAAAMEITILLRSMYGAFSWM